MSDNFSRSQIIKAASGFVAGAASVLVLTQSTVVYSQNAKRDQNWKFQQHPIPSDIGTPNFEIKNQAVRSDAPDLCLGVDGADTRPPRPGTPVEVFPCGTELDPKDRRRDQLWRVDAADPGFVRIRNYISPNYCLGVVGVDRPRPGSRAEIFNCFGVPGDERRDNQWRIETIGGNSQIKNAENINLCLGVLGVDRPKAGSPVAVFTCR